MTKVKAVGISEIFSSLQGEGTHLGERHLFVRFENCNIHCEYCDELGKLGAPTEIEEAVRQIWELDASEGPHSYISFTGGEPLLYTDFIQKLTEFLQPSKFKFYLETNGILWKQLAQVIQKMDVIAMDLKPASVTKDKRFVTEHREFLQIASQREVFTKIVISKEIDVDEFVELCEVVSGVNDKIPLILQPISTSAGEGHDDFQLMSLLDQLQRIGSGILRNVKIVPRLHRILNIR